MKYSEEQVEFAKSYLAKLGLKGSLETVSEKDRVKILNAYRAKKKRTSDAKKGERKVTVNLTKPAHEILLKLAKKDSVTLSQWIVGNLYDYSPSIITPSHEDPDKIPAHSDTATEIVEPIAISIPKKAIKSTRKIAKDFDIEIVWQSRLSSGTSSGYCRPGIRRNPEVKIVIYNELMICRDQMKGGKAKIFAIGEAYDRIMDNEHFYTLTAEKQCALVAAILESKPDGPDGDHKYPPRVDPNDIAATIRKWLEIKRSSSAIGI